MRGLWLGLAAAVCVGLGLFWKFRSAPPDAGQTTPQTPAVAVESASSAPLPKLEESDVSVRGRLQALSNQPKLAEWLTVDNLIRRVVAAVSIVAEGKSPRDSLKFLAPGQPFAVKKKDGKTVIDPQSFARYDLLAAVVDSLPAEATAKVFQDFKPLFQQAYEELGAGKGDFSDALRRAIDVLAAAPAPAPAGDIELRKKVISYAMVDDALEALSPAQKHLLRMGPKNQAKIQEKLRAISRALDLRP